MTTETNIPAGCEAFDLPTASIEGAISQLGQKLNYFGLTREGNYEFHEIGTGLPYIVDQSGILIGYPNQRIYCRGKHFSELNPLVGQEVRMDPSLGMERFDIQRAIRQSAGDVHGNVWDYLPDGGNPAALFPFQNRTTKHVHLFDLKGVSASKNIQLYCWAVWAGISKPPEYVSFAGEVKPPEPPITATLWLDAEGKRRIEVSSPLSVTKAELARIQAWIALQLLVEDDQGAK